MGTGPLKYLAVCNCTVGKPAAFFVNKECACGHQDSGGLSIYNSEKNCPLIGIALLSACKSGVFMMAECQRTVMSIALVCCQHVLVFSIINMTMMSHANESSQYSALVDRDCTPSFSEPNQKPGAFPCAKSAVCSKT